MKKKLIFIMNNLMCGGAEKSLISLLQTIDYSQYDVDLMLFKQEGLFLSKIPKEVRLLDEPNGYRYFDMSIMQSIIECLKKGRVDIVFLRICFGYIFRTERNNARREQRAWKFVSNSLKKLNKKYDVAIGYLEKNPIYYCLEKVHANKKIGVIHSDYNKLGMDSKIDIKYFNKLDRLITVSNESAVILKKAFPNLFNKINVVHNIVSPEIIRKMALEKVGIELKGIKIVSVGRLEFVKGFDLAIEACEMLVKKGYDIKWFILGEGGERKKLEKMIKEKCLERNFVLLGVRENPYPYIREADIYVHTSRFEGKSIAIDEAKILQKPIVVTGFTTIKDQIINRINGLVVDINANSIFEGISTLIMDADLKNKFINNLKEETLGTESEINKFYENIC